MNKSSINIDKPNDAWIIHREEIITQIDGLCNVYFIIDAYSGFCFGSEVFVEEPREARITHLFTTAFNKVRGKKPKKVLVANNDPYIDILQDILNKLNIKIYPVPQKELFLYIEDFIKDIKEFKRNPNTISYKERPQDESNFDNEQKMAEAMIPDTYSPCPCASGKNFKFCCQKAFEDIILACGAAERGNLKEALFYLEKAEAKVGRTAEIVCRYAICWAFFDKAKYSKYIKEAIALNPNHPRTNYLLGIEARDKEQYELAIDYYTKAINNYPKSDKFHLNEAYNNLGTVYYQLQNYEKAKEAWEQGFVLLPYDDMIRDNLFYCIYNNELVPSEIRQISPFIKRFIGE